MRPLEHRDKELVERAKEVARAFAQEQWHGEQISTVGAAVRVNGGAVYTAPNIYHPASAPACLCAEQAALAKAYSEGRRDVDVIVAYRYWDESEERVLAPCGRCRDFLRLFGNPWIIVQRGEELGKVRLSELYPLINPPWEISGTPDDSSWNA